MKFRTVFKPSDTVEYYVSILDKGISGIEVLYWEPYLNSKEFDSFESLVLDLSQEHECGLSVHAPHIDVNLGSSNKYARELAQDLLLRSAKWATRLGADVLVVHPGLGVDGMSQGNWHHGYPSPKGWKQDKLQSIGDAIRACAKSFPNLTLAVENMIFPHEFFRTPSDLKCLLEVTNAPNVGICLDVGHATAAKQDWEDFFNELGSSILHLHLHDNDGSVDQHLPLGEGSIDYRGFIRKLENYGFSGAITLEYKVEHDPHFVLNR